MKKRHVFVLLALLLVFLIPACGKNPTAAPQEIPTEMATGPTATAELPTPALTPTIEQTTSEDLTAKRPSETVLIQGGEVTLGRSAERIDFVYEQCMDVMTTTGQSVGYCSPKEAVFGDRPSRTVIVESFYVDIYEYYGQETRLPLRVAYQEAEQLCLDRSGFLLTEDQWELAARGLESRIWPWGNEDPDPTDPATQELANIDFEGGDPLKFPEKVGMHPDGATPEGVYDLVGNTAEWVQNEIKKGGGSGTWILFGEPAHAMNADYVPGPAGFRCGYAAENQQ